MCVWSWQRVWLGEVHVGFKFGVGGSGNVHSNRQLSMLSSTAQRSGARKQLDEHWAVLLFPHLHGRQLLLQHGCRCLIGVVESAGLVAGLAATGGGGRRGGRGAHSAAAARSLVALGARPVLGGHLPAALGAGAGGAGEGEGAAHLEQTGWGG